MRMREQLFVAALQYLSENRNKLSLQESQHS